MKAKWPREAPVFKVTSGNEHWIDTIVEMVDVEPGEYGDYVVHHHCRSGHVHLGYCYDPFTGLRPLTPAAHDMVAAASELKRVAKRV